MSCQGNQFWHSLIRIVIQFQRRSLKQILSSGPTSRGPPEIPRTGHRISFHRNIWNTTTCVASLTDTDEYLYTDWTGCSQQHPSRITFHISAPLSPLASGVAPTALRDCISADPCSLILMNCHSCLGAQAAGDLPSWRRPAYYKFP